MSSTAQLPKSATNNWVVLIGFVTFVFGMFTVRANDFLKSNLHYGTLYILGSTALIIFVLDLFWLKVHQRPSTGLDFKLKKSSVERTLIKLLGLWGSVGFIALLYNLFPEYHASFYNNFKDVFALVLPFWFFAAIPYFFLIDSKMHDPKDGYWHFGQLLILNVEKVDFSKAWQHILGWLVKGFFLPLMYTYFYRDLNKFVNFDFNSINNFKTFFDFSHNTIFLIDVAVVSMGYTLSLKLTDTHIRSTEPTLKGWVVALFCYEPFWSLFGKQYLSYGGSVGWGAWLYDSPTLYAAWGSIILVLISIYLWASVVFGCRFSNLTHRGILTNGPYRYSKHPAYIAKNIAWWMMSVPFLNGFSNCLLLLALNGIYFLRAKTEEAHLSQDPTYVEYANWMNSNGVFSGLSRYKLFSFMKYKSN